MRKLLLILLLIPFFADAQVWQQNNLEYGHQFKGLKALRAFLLPLAETTAGQGRDTGAVYYRLADSSLYVYTGSQWRQVTGSGGGGSQDLQSVTDIGQFTTNGLHSGTNVTIRNVGNSATLGEWINNGNVESELYIYNVSTGRHSLLEHNYLEFKATGFNYQAIKPYATPTAAYTSFMLPNTGAAHRYFPMTFRLNGTTVAAGDTGLVDLGTISGSTILNNIGTGFDLAQQGTDNVKRLAEGFGTIFDSTTTANTVIIEVDSADVPTRTEFIDSIENVKDLITQNVDSSAARVRSGTYATRIAISSPEDGEIFTQTDRLSGMYIYNQGTWRFQGDPLSYWYYTNFTRGQTVNTAAEGYNTGPLALTGAASSDFIVNQKPYSDGWLRALLKASDVTVTVPGFDSLEVDSVIVWHETEILVDAVSDGTDSYGVSWGYDNAAGTYTSGDRIVLRYNHAASSGNWESRTVAAGSGTWTTKDTGVPFVAGTRMKLAIEIDGYARVIRFYINDALVTTHTSPDNVPFPNATTLVTGISPSMFNFDRLAGSTTRSFEVNYMFGYIIKKNF